MKISGRIASTHFWHTLMPAPAGTHLSLILAVLAITVTLSACTDAPAPTPGPADTAQVQTPTPVSTDMPASASPTPVPETVSPVPTATPEPDETDMEIDSGTAWWDVFQMATIAEQICMRNALGDELGVALESYIVDDWEMAVFSCLGPETAQTVFVHAANAQLARAYMEPNETQEACLREEVAGLHLEDLSYSMIWRGTDDAYESLESLGSFAGLVSQCLPDFALTLFFDLLGSVSISTLSQEELSCAREQAPHVDWVALLPAYYMSGGVTDDMVGLMTCTPALFLDLFVRSVYFDLTTEEEESCMRDAVVSFDMATLRDIMYHEFPVEAYNAITSCAPRLLANDIFGMAVDLTDEETSCLQEWLDGDDVEEHYGAYYSTEGFSSAFACVPVMAIIVVLDDAAWYGEEVIGNDDALFCLREGAAGVDLAALAALTVADGARTASEELLPDLLQDCVPNLVRLWESDDHPDSVSALSEYAALHIGGDATGVLDYAADLDVFAFEAQEGEIYQINVVQGPLIDVELKLYGPNGETLVRHMRCSEAPEPCITWRSPGKGEYYVEVGGGYGSYPGSYTVTAALSDIVDDHPNYHIEDPLRASSTSVPEYVLTALDQAVLGALDYAGDVDFVVFEAEEGKTYQIDVVLGTLPDSALELYGPGGELLESEDDSGYVPGSRIVWEASAAGKYYVAVSGYLGEFGGETGLYILTITLYEEESG